MESASLLAVFLLCMSYLNAQTTFSWNGTHGGSGTNRTYSAAPIGGITMSATIVNTQDNWQHTSPRYTTSSPDGGCLALASQNYGLLLGTDWTNTSQNITVNITFSHAVGAVRFRLYDINDDGFGSWRDRITISATDNSGVPVNVYNDATSCVSSAGTISGSGTSTLVYTSSSSSSCTCWGNNYVRIGNDASGCYQVKTITIQYTSATTGNPSSQYVIISDLVAACAPLPIELSSFTGEYGERGNLLKWETATEKNNSYFDIERSTDGVDWEKISNVPGAGTTLEPQYYSVYDNSFEHTVNYYRLKQADHDGVEKLSGIVTIDNSLKRKTLEKIVNTMGQIVDESYRGMKIYVYTDGTIIKKVD